MGQKGLEYFPKFFTRNAINIYFAVLVVVSLVFFKRAMSPIWWMMGGVSVISFFYFSNLMTKKWSKLKPKTFEKKLLVSALIIRIGWVIFSYFFYNFMTGKPFEFESADAFFYHNLAIRLSNNILTGSFSFQGLVNEIGLADSGYPVYLAFLYTVTGKSIIIARLIKAILSSFMCILVYRLAVRNFGESTGRITAILTLLMPNLIYYCGLHLKEVEMVFLAVAFLERVDYILRSKIFNFVNIFIIFLLAIILFAFRTVLGAVVVFSLISAIIFSTTKIFGWQKRIVIGIWVILAIALFGGGQIATDIDEIWEGRFENQAIGMEARAQREGGNTLAKYGSRAIFAPAILIIPIPTMVNVFGQENQQLIHGGNFVKEILAFFFILASILIVKQKKWRAFTLIEVYIVGYLIIVAFSNFAQSERFHLPALPVYLMFAAYGISQVTNKTKKYFNWYLIGLFFVILAWNFIKLAGRGIV